MTEQVFKQSSQVNGKILQFEGGLAVTSNIISGAYKLAGHAKVSWPVLFNTILFRSIIVHTILLSKE